MTHISEAVSYTHLDVYKRQDVVFTRNLPVNELEISQMVNNLVGIASSETLLSQLSFVGDPKEEAQLAAKEKMLSEKLKYVQE